MAALPWNPAAEVTDVTAAQSVQDRGRIKHNSYAFRDLRPFDAPLHCGVARRSKKPTQPSPGFGRHMTKSGQQAGAAIPFVTNSGGTTPEGGPPWTRIHPEPGKTRPRPLRAAAP